MNKSKREATILKNKLIIIDFALIHGLFFSQELDSCKKSTKNHTDRKAYLEALVEDEIFWTDSIKPAGKESGRYVLLQEKHLLSDPQSLLYMLADQLGTALCSNLCLFENWKTISLDCLGKSKHLTSKHLEDCGGCYKPGLDKRLPYLQIFRKFFILFLLIKEISGMENKRIKTEKDVQRYSEKLLTNTRTRCFFVSAFIKFVENYQAYIASNDHDFKTLARKLDGMYESLIYYYNFMRYHCSTLKYRISVMSKLRYKLKGDVARDLNLSSKQITNITLPIMSDHEKPDPKKIADLQDKEKGHVFIEQVKQEEIDKLLKIWNNKA